MDEIIALIVKTHGLVGVVFIAPYAAAVYLWANTLRLNKDLVLTAKELAGSKNEVIEAQKQRVQDAQMISEKLMVLVSEQSGLNKETNIALDQVREMLMMVSTNRRSS